MILSVAFERDANGQPKSYSKGVIVSTLAVALWSVMSAMLLGPDSGLNAISLTWYASIISFVLLFILWACSNEREAATAYLHSRPGDATLVHLSLSVNQIVKSCVPLPTMILSVAFERDANGQPKSYSKGVIVSLLITVLGSVLAVYGNPE